LSLYLPITSNSAGVGYSADYETVNIAIHVTVDEPSNDAISSNFADSVLINNGNVISDSIGVGVFFAGGFANEITNAKGALISGSDGVFLGQDSVGSQIFYNSGKVVGTVGDGIDFSAAAGQELLNNHGSIIGAYTAVTFSIDSTDTAGGAINNYGLIKGNVNLGLAILDYAHLTTVINNSATGVIQGPTVAIESFDGGIKLHNHGKIIGNIVNSDSTGVGDVIFNAGKILGSVHLGTGKSYFNGTGGISGAIFAEGGNDRIIAGNGNVAIHVGTGSDVLTAGTGHDKFFFDDALAGQIEKITNFNPVLDKFVLSFDGLSPLGGTLSASEFHIGRHAITASQYIIYNPNTGFLFYNPHDGTAQAHFATISPHLAMTHADFLVGA
jgi:hypothetical protein